MLAFCNRKQFWSHNQLLSVCMILTNSDKKICCLPKTFQERLPLRAFFLNIYFFQLNIQYTPGYFS